MSDCGGLIVACLAAPLLLVVLLVAGVGYLALQGARLVGSLALQGIEFAGQALASGVRAASQAIAAAGTYVSSAVSQGVQWGSSLFDSTQVGDRLRAAAHTAYASASIGRKAQPTKTAERQTTSVPQWAVGMMSSAQSVSATAPSTTEVFAAAPAGTPHQTEVAGRQEAIASMSRAEAIRSALEAEVPLQLVAQQRYGSQLTGAQAALASAQDRLRTGEMAQAGRFAGEAEALLTTAVHSAHDTLVRAERATIAATVGNTLEDLGYTVRAARVDDTVALVGRREHHALALVVQPGGRLEMDMAGFEGDSCSLETKALLEALRRNGLMITAEQITRHGRFEGGGLIKKTQRRGQSLSVALAELMAAPEAEAPVRRRSSHAQRTEAERLHQAQVWMWGQSQQQMGGR